jgi:putative addiction module component (TIGR02574 family)
MSGAVMDISIDQLRSLPLEKRLELINKLWESLGEDAYEHFPIPDEVIAEAERDYEEHLADPSSSIPWAIARARLRERYG